jgi:hypothetical protein
MLQVGLGGGAGTGDVRPEEFDDERGLDVAGYWPYIEAGEMPWHMQLRNRVAVAPELNV